MKKLNDEFPNNEDLLSELFIVKKGLDGENEKDILEIFKKLAHEDGKCVIIVTHSPNVCEEVDQVYDLKKVK